jgi:5,10-methylenetetrahydrofolate reductase
MPKISEILAVAEKEDRPWIAFEYFPPRTPEGVKTLYSRFKRMASQSA